MYVFVDALDELKSSGRSRQTFLEGLSNIQIKTSLNLFATSRSIPEISAHFSMSSTLEILATEEDVARYVKSHINELSVCVQQSAALQQSAIDQISKAVGGM